MKLATLSKTQHALLTTIIRGSTSPQRLVLRATIILAGSETSNQSAMAQRLRIDRNTVHHWLMRWQNATFELDRLEIEYTAKRLSDQRYLRALTGILDDAPRPGAPAVFTEEDKRQILALASEEPEKVGVPVTNWTYTLITKTVIHKGIVKKISRAQIGRFLKESTIKAASE